MMFLLKKLISLNVDQRIETDASGTSKDLVSEKEEIKCNNIIKQ